MIAVTVLKNEQGIIEFECKGHAGFDQYGKDIVCSAVSVLIINTINSIEELTTQKTSTEFKDSDGYIHCTLSSPFTREAALLLESMLLGLKGIQKNYGKKYLDLKFKEV